MKRDTCRYCRECIPYAKIPGKYSCIQTLEDTTLSDICERFLFVGKLHKPERSLWV